MGHILVADDDKMIARILRDRLVKRGYSVLTAHDGARALALAEGAEVALLDLQMPLLDGLAVLEQLKGRHDPPVVIMITAHGDVQSAVRAMKAGAFDFVTKPFDGEHIEQLVERARDRKRLTRQVESLRDEVDRRHVWVRGPDPKMAEVAERVDKVAPTPGAVLLVGETGTGKEVVARAVHGGSKRASGPFVTVNATAFKRALQESEIFGHEEGAFEGAARSRTGQLEKAAGGTLFIDEIGALGPDLQAKLLRVLQVREYERLGGDRTRLADVRLIAASNRDLGQAVSEGAFLADLYFRLKVVTIELPPLRKRRGDTAVLAEHYLEQKASEIGRARPKLSAEVQAAMLQWSWPGNVRELAHVMERCVLFGSDPVSLDDLPEEMVPASASSLKAARWEDVGRLPYREAVQAARRLIVAEALRLNFGNEWRTAEHLGVSPSYLARLCLNLGVTD